MIKRAIDMIVSAAALLLLSPLLALIAVGIKLSSPGPVLFRQRRMGKEGHYFEILKFRTMIADAEERKSEVAHLNIHAERGSQMFNIRRPQDHKVRREAPAMVSRRDAAAVERAKGGYEPCSCPSPNPGGSGTGQWASHGALADASRNHGPMADPWTQPDPLLRDDPPGLHLRVDMDDPRRLAASDVGRRRRH